MAKRILPVPSRIAPDMLVNVAIAFDSGRVRRDWCFDGRLVCTPAGVFDQALADVVVRRFCPGATSVRFLGVYPAPRG